MLYIQHRSAERNVKPYSLRVSWRTTDQDFLRSFCCCSQFNCVLHLHFSFHMIHPQRSAGKNLQTLKLLTGTSFLCTCSKWDGSTSWTSFRKFLILVRATWLDQSMTTNQPMSRLRPVLHFVSFIFEWNQCKKWGTQAKRMKLKWKRISCDFFSVDSQSLIGLLFHILRHTDDSVSPRSHKPTSEQTGRVATQHHPNNQPKLQSQPRLSLSRTLNPDLLLIGRSVPCIASIVNINVYMFIYL